MELFDFESDERAVKAREEYKSTPAQPVEAESNSVDWKPQDGQSLLQTIVMIVVAIVLVILLVLFARWLYHKVHHSSQNTSTNTSQTAQRGSALSTEQGAKSQPSTSNNSTPSTSNNVLPNSGPGNVAAIFAASSLAAAGLHYIYTIRRDTKYR